MWGKSTVYSLVDSQVLPKHAEMAGEHTHIPSEHGETLKGVEFCVFLITTGPVFLLVLNELYSVIFSPEMGVGGHLWPLLLFWLLWSQLRTSGKPIHGADTMPKRPRMEGNE